LGLIGFLPGGGVVTEAIVDPDEAAIAERVCAAVDRLGAMPGGVIAALAAFAFHFVFFFGSEKVKTIR
jgi:hypothetical protein